jgi:hypothetical protein
MKNSYFTFMSVIILGIVMSLNVKAQSLVNDKVAAKAFVQKFYDWFNILQTDEHFTEKHHASPFSFAVAKRGDYFDAPLYKAIENYFHTPMKGDEIGLDFDPIAAAQDTRSGFQTGNVKQIGHKFFVDLHDIPSGRSEKEILATETFLIVETVKIGKDWKLANFIYPADKNSKQTDLLKILAHQKKFGY